MIMIYNLRTVKFIEIDYISLIVTNYFLQEI